MVPGPLTEAPMKVRTRQSLRAQLHRRSHGNLGWQSDHVNRRAKLDQVSQLFQVRCSEERECN
jgi:hypothetical protein